MRFRPQRLMSSDRFRSVIGQKRLFQNKFVLVRGSKYITNTDESSMFPSQLINIICVTPGVSDFINDRLGNIFYNLLGRGLSNVLPRVSHQGLVVVTVIDP